MVVFHHLRLECIGEVVKAEVGFLKIKGYYGDVMNITSRIFRKMQPF